MAVTAADGRHGLGRGLHDHRPRRPCRWRCAGTAAPGRSIGPGRTDGVASLFTDVAMLGQPPRGGLSHDPATAAAEPIAARRDRTRWVYVSPRTGKRESVSLTGVAPDGRGGLWVVGHGGPGTEIGPVIYRRDDARWTRHQGAPPARRGRPRRCRGQRRRRRLGRGLPAGRRPHLPLVLRWDGRTWTRVEAPDFDSPEVVLTAVRGSRRAASGSSARPGTRRWESHEAVAAWWDGTGLERGRGSRGRHRAARRRRLARYGWLGRRPVRPAVEHGPRLPAGPVRESSAAASRAPSRHPPSELASQGTGRGARGGWPRAAARRRGGTHDETLAARRSGKDRPTARATRASGQGRRAERHATGLRACPSRRAGRTVSSRVTWRRGRHRRADGHLRGGRGRLRRRRR